MFKLNIKSILKKIGAPTYYKLPAAALDISDHSIKYMELKKTELGYLPENYEKFTIPENIIKSGEILDLEALRDELKKIRIKYPKFKFVNISLPEELAFVFTVTLKKSDIEDSSVRQLIEFKLPEFVPFNAANTLFDFELIADYERVQVYSVVVYSKKVVQEYIDATEAAGFMVKSAELETLSMARAIIPRDSIGDEKPVLVLDIGNNKIGLAILLKGTPLFTSTVQAPVNKYFTKMYKDYSKTDKIENEQLNNWKFKKGLVYTRSELIEEFSKNTVSEIRKILNYYNSHKGEQFGKVSRVYVCGGNAAVKGIESVIAAQLNLDTEKGSVWQNMFNLEKYIPDIDKQSSFMYATVVGLLLKDEI